MFSKTTQYALRAATYLGQQPGRRVTSQEVAGAAGVSVKYMAKVMLQLSNAGVVESQRGPTGGFWLTADPAETSLLDIVSAIEPIQRIHECPLKLERHCDELCPLHSALDGLAEAAQNRLAATMLTDLANQNTTELGLPGQ
ncbi:MAG: Rrf2 family transcriptional regulator [Planctomycetota bacterium]